MKRAQTVKERGTRPRFRAAAGSWLLATLLVSSSLRAQAPTSQNPGDEALILAVNTALGALTALFARASVHKPIGKATLQGAVGGAVSYGGKRLLARNDEWTNLIGRQIAATGGSVVSNASYGLDPLDQLVFPYGPVRFHWKRSAPHSVSAKFDLATSLVMIRTVRRGGISLDVNRSVHSGVAIFSVDSGSSGDAQISYVGGSQLGGVILHRDRAQRFIELPETVNKTIGHELVHASQYDFSFIVWAAPAERALMGESKLTAFVNRYVDLGLNVPVWSGLNKVVPYRYRPWEKEAFTFSQ